MTLRNSGEVPATQKTSETVMSKIASKIASAWVSQPEFCRFSAVTKRKGHGSALFGLNAFSKTNERRQSLDKIPACSSGSLSISWKIIDVICARLINRRNRISAKRAMQIEIFRLFAADYQANLKLQKKRCDYF